MTDGIFGDDNGDSLNFQLDTTDVDADSLYSGGGVNKEGYYHVVAMSPELTNEKEKLPGATVTLHIVAGTEDDQCVKNIYHKLFFKGWEKDKEGKKTGSQVGLSAKQKNNLARFLDAFGVINKSDIGGASANIPWHLMEGRQAIIEVRQEKEWVDDDGKKHPGGFKIPFNNAWPIRHERVKDVPKDPESLAMLCQAVDTDVPVAAAANEAVDISDV